MAAKKVVGNPIIDNVLASLTKKFGGREDIGSLGPKIENCEVFTTGSLTLDAAIGTGGCPNDRIVEIYGPESAGKTSLALQILRWHIDAYGYSRTPVFIDLERTTSIDLVKSMGIDPTKILFLYPNTAEEAFQMAEDLGTSGEVGVCIFDSLDAAQTQKETQRDMDENSMGELPRLTSRAFRTLSKTCTDKKCLYIIINQIRMKIGVMYGDPETTSGGNALRYYASLRLRVSSKPVPNTPNMLEMSVKIKKNKLAPVKLDAVKINFVPGRGVEPIRDAIDFAKSVGLLRFAGSSVQLSMPNTEKVTICSGGKEGAYNYYKNNPAELNSLREVAIKISQTDLLANTAIQVELENDEGI